MGTLTGQDGRGLNELRGVTVPVRATGPLMSPSFGLDFNALLTDSVKQKAADLVQSKLEEQVFGKKAGAVPSAPGGASPAPTGQDAAKGVAKDVLKGIFGR